MRKWGFIWDEPFPLSWIYNLEDLERIQTSMYFIPEYIDMIEKIEQYIFWMSSLMNIDNVHTSKLLLNSKQIVHGSWVKPEWQLQMLLLWHILNSLRLQYLHVMDLKIDQEFIWTDSYVHKEFHVFGCQLRLKKEKLMNKRQSKSWTEVIYWDRWTFCQSCILEFQSGFELTNNENKKYNEK